MVLVTSMKLSLKVVYTAKLSIVTICTFLILTIWKIAPFATISTCPYCEFICHCAPAFMYSSAVFYMDVSHIRCVNTFGCGSGDIKPRFTKPIKLLRTKRFPIIGLMEAESENMAPT